MGSKRYKKLTKKLVNAPKKVAKKVGRKAIPVVGRVIRFGAPIAGGLLFGPAGAAAGTAIGAGTARYTEGVRARDKGKSGRDAREFARNRMKGTLKFGAAVTAATGVGALLAGTGLTGSPLKALFGGGAKGEVSAQDQADVDAGQALEGGGQTAGEIDKAMQNSGADAAQGGVLKDVFDFGKNIYGKATGSNTAQPTGEEIDAAGDEEPAQAGILSRVPLLAWIAVPVIGYFAFRGRRKAA